jgi:hypothetical protein
MYRNYAPVQIAEQLTQGAKAAGVDSAAPVTEPSVMG